MITYNGSDLILAPLAGFGDSGMRSLCFYYGAGLCFTEMVSAKGLYYKNENTEFLTRVGKDEKYTGIQLFGSDPDIIAEVVGYDAIKNFPIIDINCGCPVPKVYKNGEGSALLKDPELIYKIIKKLKEAANGRLVTAKMRKGTDGQTRVIECALAAQEGGADMVTVHGRTREQMYSGTVDYDVIALVKEKLKIPVCGNGDVFDRNGYLRMKQTGADYVMVARGAIGRPYVFAEIRGEKPEYCVAELIKKHIKYIDFLPERTVVGGMKKQIAAYVKGMAGQKRIKEKIFAAEDMKELLEAVDGILPNRLT